VLLTDVFEKLNQLNISLQGRGKWLFEPQTPIHAFVNTFKDAWFRQFLQKKQQFSVALPTP